MPITTLAGDNSYLINQFIKDRLDNFVDPSGIDRLDVTSISTSELIVRLSNVSLFSLRKLIIIRGLSHNSELCDDIDKILSQNLTDVELIIVEPNLDGRLKIYKQLKSKTDFKELKQLAEPALADWLTKQAKSAQAGLSYNDAVYLVDKVGPNQELCFQELQKLILYDQQITKKTIDLLIMANPRSQAFDLINAAFEKNHQQVVKLYEEQRLLKKEPIELIGLIAWQLHLMAVVMSASTKSYFDIAKDLGTYSSVIDKTARLARSLNAQQLSQAIERLLIIDDKTKQTAINSDDALLYFLLSL